MRFLDANVFIYAYYRPKRQLTQIEKRMKDEAKRIIHEVSQGREEVTLTVVHLSEVVNILKHGMPIEELAKVVLGLFMLDNVEIRGVSREAYFAAAELGVDLKLDPNDALAVDFMRLNNIREIYSFDEDFDG
ncbi:MAG: type II toxin-antitoxin system VapC family toxin, partial [Candidatus Bathyarchaeia archaeon]